MNVNAPYYLSFSAERAPTTVDHSRRNPGPADGTQRAGYTRFTLDARIRVESDEGPVGSDGLVPFYFESVNVYFFLKDFSVEISSDYRVGSCPYQVTREHEFESHVRRPTSLFNGYRDRVAARLNQIPLPTQQSPRRIPRGQAAATDSALMRPVVQAVGQLKEQLRQTLERDRHQQDSPAAYRLLYARCRPDEWGGRGF